MKTITENINLAPVPYSIASFELDSFARLSFKERIRVRNLLDIFAKIGSYKSAKQACQSLSITGTGRGFSWQSIYRLYKLYIDSGYDWSVLCHNYKSPNKGKPLEFQKFIAGLVSQCKGRTDVGAAVYTRLLNEFWFAGKCVPGYGTFLDFWQKKYPNTPLPSRLYDCRALKPTGWSKRRISDTIKKVSPRNSLSRNLTAFGWHATHSNFEQLLRDRSKLKPMQLITFDDIEFDLQAVYKIGNTFQVCTVQAVMALDVATGLILDYGVRPIYKDTDTKKLRHLTRQETFSILLNLLTKQGLPVNYPVRLLLENASATLLTDDKDMLEASLPNRFIIENTRMANRTLTQNGFIEKSGMPYQKGWIEASFRPLLTRFSHLLGTTSRRYETRHSSHKEIVKYTLDTLNNANAKGIDYTKFKLPILTGEQVFEVVSNIIDAFNNRVNHSLQGFDNVFEAMQENGSFCNINLLEASNQSVGTQIYKRKESPLERYSRLKDKQEFTKVSPAVLAPLMLNKRKVKVRNSQIEILDESFSTDKLYYRSGALCQLEGGEYLAGFAKNRNSLFIFSKDEGFICEVPRLQRVDITDQKEILKRSGEVHRSRMEDVQRVRQDLENVDNYYKQMRVHNELVFKENERISQRIEESQKSLEEKVAYDNNASFSPAVSLDDLTASDKTEFETNFNPLTQLIQDDE